MGMKTYLMTLTLYHHCLRNLHCLWLARRCQTANWHKITAILCNSSRDDRPTLHKRCRAQLGSRFKPLPQRLPRHPSNAGWRATIGTNYPTINQWATTCETAIQHWSSYTVIHRRFQLSQMNQVWNGEWVQSLNQIIPIHHSPLLDHYEPVINDKRTIQLQNLFALEPEFIKPPIPQYPPVSSRPLKR